MKVVMPIVIVIAVICTIASFVLHKDNIDNI